MQSTTQEPLGNNGFHDHITPRPPKKECSLMKDEAIRKIFTNQTGRFPKKSSCENQYIIDVNSDAILVKPMKNRTSGKMIRAYQTV
jgi:hypothetical protein